jgi:hypothetical protein
VTVTINHVLFTLPVGAFFADAVAVVRYRCMVVTLVTPLHACYAVGCYTLPVAVTLYRPRLLCFVIDSWFSVPVHRLIKRKFFLKIQCIYCSPAATISVDDYTYCTYTPYSRRLLLMLFTVHVLLRIHVFAEMSEIFAPERCPA